MPGATQALAGTMRVRRSKPREDYSIMTGAKVKKMGNTPNKWVCVAICNDPERSRRFFGGTCLPVKNPYPISVNFKGQFRECYILDVQALPDFEFNVLVGCLANYFNLKYDFVKEEVSKNGALIFAEDVTISYPFDPAQIPQTQYTFSF